MVQLGQVARELEGEPGRFSNILISVDGKRDTPEAMARFLKQFSPTIIGLTGDPETVERVATDFKAVFFKGMPTDTQGGYDVEHTPQVYLVDRAGRLRATFYSASVDAMVDATRASCGKNEHEMDSWSHGIDGLCLAARQRSGLQVRSCHRAWRGRLCNGRYRRDPRRQRGRGMGFTRRQQLAADRGTRGADARRPRADLWHVVGHQRR